MQRAEGWGMLRVVNCVTRHSGFGRERNIPGIRECVNIKSK